MFGRGPNSVFGLYAQLAGVLALVILAVLAGLWLGEKSVHFEEGTLPAHSPAPVAAGAAPEAGAAGAPPLFFLVHIPSGAGEAAVLEEIKMAADAGIHQYVVRVPLPWRGDMNAFLGPIDLLTQADPNATMFLYLTLDPPPAWLAANPAEAARVAGREPSSASLASEVWRRDAHSALEALASAINVSLRSGSILGYVVGCLDAGQWQRTDGYDVSPANTDAFRRWLTARYKENAALQQAWDDPEVKLDTALIPDKPDTAGPCPSFFETLKEQRQVDFLQYTSEITADTIAAFTGYVKRAAGKSVKVIAPYGYTDELTASDSGHFALSRLLSTELDGFVSPVSYFDRGLGGVGGVMGPVDSVLAHQKTWFLIDDTRTGIARDPVTGEVARPKNIRAEDVYRVQQRNFAAAVTRGLGLWWADPQGDGWLHDPEMWQRFAKMWNVYQKVNTWRHGEREQTPSYSTLPTLAVVVDETCRFYQRCDKVLNELLLNQVRDSAVRAGLPTKFYLLSDLLAENAPSASVYLFLNAFRLASDERARLHAVLQHNRAAAIWMYAPGYIDGSPSVENISATARIRAQAFEGPAQTGSVFLLPEKWMGKDEEFGAALEVQPLFYIEDLQTDVLAKFRASGKPSVAISFFEEGWASIFCAEPCLTPALLRQILSILEMPICFQVTPTKFYDAVYFGPSLMAIHGKEMGERVVNLDRVYDIQDLLAPEIGWPRKQVFNLPLKTGETRLLKLTPVEPEEAP